MRLILTLAATALIVGCAGKAANPTPRSEVGDEYLGCHEIELEQAHIANRVAVLMPESKKGVKNTALGVTGFFLIVPWFFMDFSDAEKVEIQAYQDRSHKLDMLASRKRCHEERV